MVWLIKKHEGSFSDFGIYPGARELKEYIRNGIIILDKPSGPTCNDVDKWVREILQINKCSHGGTLDPNVSGVLPIALENTTKLMPVLLSSKKEYVGVVRLHKEVEASRIRKAFTKFVGRVKQLPPLKSAVARKEREREIYDLNILEIEGKSILFRIECEAGFYVRRFAVDIGKEFGVKSQLQELRRTRSGNFTEKDCKTLHELIDATNKDNKVRELILPMEAAVEKIGKIIVSDNTIDNICNGAPLALGGIVKFEDCIKRNEWVAIFSLKGELVAIGKALMDSEEIQSNKKGLVVKTDRVLMRRGTYKI